VRRSFSYLLEEESNAFGKPRVWHVVLSPGNTPAVPFVIVHTTSEGTLCPLCQPLVRQLAVANQ